MIFDPALDSNDDAEGLYAMLLMGLMVGTGFGLIFGGVGGLLLAGGDRESAAPIAGGTAGAAVGTVVAIGVLWSGGGPIWVWITLGLLVLTWTGIGIASGRSWLRRVAATQQRSVPS